MKGLCAVHSQSPIAGILLETIHTLKIVKLGIGSSSVAVSSQQFKSLCFNSSRGKWVKVTRAMTKKLPMKLLKNNHRFELFYLNY